MYLIKSIFLSTIFLTFFFLSPGATVAQSTTDWIISFKSAHNPDIQSLKNSGSVKNLRPIFRDLNLWSFSTDIQSETELRKHFIGNPNVRYLHKDFITEPRYIPNDPDFIGQWNLNQIGMDRVWDLTKGELAPNGDKIVVGIFDDGFQVDHADFVSNVWVNKNEIPNNDIDDDENGFADDYYGWNSTSQDDIHEVRNHGTAVAGIIGAVGDNNRQIAGINWNVDLLLTSGGRQGRVTISDIVQGYEYMYEQRKTYNETKGQKGAYVVVSNYSGGAKNLFPIDAPAWCEVFDKLGSVGILNIGSTDNSDINVEEVGDLPSTCTSDYLIVVTNTDRVDAKVASAAYGVNSVDIGAPGDDVYASAIGSSIDEAFFGTSAAAPHVAGVISILYGLICEEAFFFSLENPANTALQMKSAIMNSVSSSLSLEEITVSGGRLNAFGAMEIIEESIGNCCEVFIDDISIQNESCDGAVDGQINIEASGNDLQGSLLFDLTSSSVELSNRLGNFSRLAAGNYNLKIKDDEQTTCVIDSMIFIESILDICPYGDFQIETIRQTETSIILEYSIDEQKDVQIQVYNNLGQLMYNRLVTPTLTSVRNQEVTVSNWPSGVYHASILANGIRDVESFYVLR